MEILDRFGVNIYLLIAYLVNFLIIVFVLDKFVFRKALKNIENRKKLAEDLLKNTQNAKNALENAKVEFNKIVDSANNKALEIVGKADDNAKKISQEIQEKALLQAELILKKAHDQIESEHITLKSELQKELGTLVADTVERIVGGLDENEKKKIMLNIDNRFVN